MTGWLLKHLVDDHIRLTRNQLSAVHRHVIEQATRRKLGWLLIHVLPGLCPLLVIRLWHHLAKSWTLPWRIGAEVAFVVAWLAAWLWLLRRQYARYARQAIAELGFADICVRCGYDFSGIAERVGACPECGAVHQPIAPPHGSLPRDPPSGGAGG